MQAIIAVVLSFVLTGLIGARLAQAWQQRNWIRQQQFLGGEKNYIALRDLAAELAKLLGARQYRMRQLLYAAFSLSEQEMEDRLLDYRTVLADWNESLPSFFVRLTTYGGWDYTYSLEETLQTGLVSAGARIEAAVRRRRAGKPHPPGERTAIERDLNRLQGRINAFNRDLLGKLDRVRREIYFGQSIPYNTYWLDDFSTLDLIKALFVRDVDGHSIVRPLAHPKLPIRGGR
jgi:hypothetical protein